MKFSKKSQAIGFIAFLLIIVVGLFIWPRETNGPNNDTTDFTQPLTYEEYKALEDELIQLVESADPRTAMTELKELAAEDGRILRDCHDFVHSIGHSAYFKYEDFGEAMTFMDDWCNSGYIHGIIEVHFQTSEDVFSDMNTLCTIYDQRSFESWQCYHGVGHGMMYFSSNDLPTSLAYCEQIIDEWGRDQCINGVFMENFNADNDLHETKFVSESDPFYPCYTYENAAYKSHCYTYMPTYFLANNPNQYQEALELCTTAEADAQNTCAFGVGTQMYKENLSDIKKVEEICNQSGGTLTASCVQGAAGYAFFHYGTIEAIEQVCEELSPLNQSHCQTTVDATRASFPE